MDNQLPRRSFITRLSLAVTSLTALPLVNAARSLKESFQPISKMKTDPIKSIKAMGFQWETADPFLFCVHHEDHFPAGNDAMGPPASSLNGRHMGDDFIIKDGFRMYHGKVVPGFPGHPHRGFETITVVRKGLVDHADSMGASGRYGNGDVQWMTAGKGVQHSEMFPLIHKDKDNTMELFQIWLNLPKQNKMVEPHFKMLWAEAIPNYTHKDKNGKKSSVEVIAGTIGGLTAVSPPPNSWSANPQNHVAVWNIKMQPGAIFTLPAAMAGINRNIYYYEGDGMTLAGTTIPKYSAIDLHPDMDVELVAGADGASILLLQGKPINEPVIQYGPFVMNTKEEINQAFTDYHNTKFGGWPWSRYDQVHPRDKGRFAKHADGREEVKS
ncbi:MAG TPA: pirin family protein [Chitinophagales bacterium]|nr:pirin family protein [Chitinophagales bacterium]